MIEKEETEKAALQYEIEKPEFQSDVADREEIPCNERTQKFGKMKDVQVTPDIVKPVMTVKSAMVSSIKR